MSPEKLNEFPECRNIGRPVGSKYDQYLDGSVWRLTQDIDFHGDARKFVRSIRQHANSRRGIGLSAMVQNDGKSIVVQATPKH